jgi:hypothetical protein
MMADRDADTGVTPSVTRQHVSRRGILAVLLAGLSALLPFAIAQRPPDQSPLTGETATPAREERNIANILRYGGIKNDDSIKAIRANIEAIDKASRAAADSTVYLPAGTWYIGAPPDRWGGFALWAGNDQVNRGATGLGFVGDGPGQTTLKWGYIKENNSNSIRYFDGTDHGSVTWRNLTYDGNCQQLEFGTDGLQKAIDIEGSTELRLENVQLKNFDFGGIDTRGVDLSIDKCAFSDIGFGHANRTDSSHSHPVGVSGAADVTITNTEFHLIIGSCVDYRNGVTGELVMDTIYAEAIGVNLVKLNDASAITLRHITHIGQTEELLARLDDDGTQEFRGDYFLRRIDSDRNDDVPVTMEHIRCEDLNWAFIRADGEAFSLSGGTAGPISISHTTFNDTSGAIEVANDGSIDFDIGELSIHDVEGDPIWESDEGTFTGTIKTFRWSADDTLGDTGEVTIDTPEQGEQPFDPDVPGRTDVGVQYGPP